MNKDATNLNQAHGFSDSQARLHKYTFKTLRTNKCFRLKADVKYLRKKLPYKCSQSSIR